MKKTRRTVNYYDLSLIDDQRSALTSRECLQQTFTAIINMAAQLQPERYIAYGGRFIFIQEVTIDPVGRTLRGKLRSVKKDVKPEIIDMLTDVSRQITTAEDEGIVETSHFVINYSRDNRRPIVAFEYNRSGGGIMDLVNYIQRVGREYQLLTDVSIIPIGRGPIDQIVNRINRCSEITIRVHKENIPRLQPIDDELFQAMTGLEQAFNNDTVTIKLDYDYKDRQTTEEGSGLIERIANHFIRRPDEMEVFESFTFTAEDEDKNNRLETFDLLLEKQKSSLNISLNEGHSTIVSSDIFSQIDSEIVRKRLLT